MYIINNLIVVSSFPHFFGINCFHEFCSVIRYRTYVTGEPKEQQETEHLSENEKKLTCEIQSLTNEVQSLKEKHDEILDKYKRSLADSENLRVRLTKQIEDARIFGIQGFCKDLLEVADILGHATDAVPKEQVCLYIYII